MSDYIKREDAETVIDKQYNRADESLGFGDIEGVKTGILWGKALIASLPSADVVEVVRCKDCKYRREEDICFEYLGMTSCTSEGCGMCLFLGDEGYCSYGELKEQENE